MAKYNIDDINVGDEVIFDSTNLQSNHDHYWSVVGKMGDDVKIELKKFGYDENWTINIEEVIGHIPFNKN